MSNFLLIADGVKDFGTEKGFCYQSADIWQVVGYVLMVFKIVIPVILIIFGMIDLGRSVVSGKDDEIKKNMKSLMIRAIAAIVIFFIPNIVALIMNVVSKFGDVEKDFKVCKICISSPSKEDCKKAAANAGE